MKNRPRKLKIRYDRIIKCAIIIFALTFTCVYFFTLKLTNIYVIGNKNVKDQEVIELAGISNYPKMISINANKTEKKILSNNLITNVKITKRFSNIIIEINETNPIYYDSNTSKTVLVNGKTVDEKYNVPILVNYIPDTIVEEFNSCMSKLSFDILNKISEIKYDPNIDKERFLLTMNDGNYVYINTEKFELIDNYLTIISNFKDKKGIIYLDSGSHFKLFDES